MSTSTKSIILQNERVKFVYLKGGKNQNVNAISHLIMGTTSLKIDMTELLIQEKQSKYR